MILLDTHVILETQRQQPNTCVLDWMDAQALKTLYLSAITVAELRAGIALLPAGKRRSGLQENLEKRLLPMFANPGADGVLTFDRACTHVYAELPAKSRAAGWALASADVLIAAVALTNGFTVATRDAGPVAAARLIVINSWETGQ